MNAEVNRHRRYSLLVQLGFEGGGELIVTWGRIGRRPRSRVEHFSSQVELERRYHVLMARRSRHDYVPVSAATFESTSAIPSAPLEGAVLDVTTRYLPARQSNGYMGVFDGQLQIFVVRDAELEVVGPLARSLNRDPGGVATLLLPG